jgi:hypothetical protein
MHSGVDSGVQNFHRDYGGHMDEIYGLNKCWNLAFFANITAVSFAGILSKLRRKKVEKASFFSGFIPAGIFWLL